VEDNGVGMDEKTASNLLNSSILPKPEQASNHIGIVNVNERIHLMFGPDYGITVQSRKGIGTQILLRIPIITDKEEIAHVQAADC
jgi:two-component system sensor histidine kinase YesM